MFPCLVNDRNYFCNTFLSGLDTMEFIIEKNRLLQMLKLLNVNGLYPEIIISSKKDKINSFQTETYGHAFRFALFEKNYFVDIVDEGVSDAIRVNYNNLYNCIKKLTKGKIKFYTHNNILFIESEKGKLKVTTYVLKESEVQEGLIFKMDKGIPVLKPDDEKIRLDTKIKLNRKELIDLVEGLEKIDYKKTLDIKKDEIVLRGSLDNGSFNFSYPLRGEILSFVKPIKNTYTQGFLQTIKTLSDNPIMQLTNNAPIWISNSVPNYYNIGVLLPPYTYDDEMEDDIDES